MLTPLDIQKREFGKAIRGYNEREVDEFMMLVSQAMEKHIVDVAEQKDRNLRLTEDLSKYKQLEKTMSDTLVVAKKTSEDMLKTASQQADNIVKEAELRAIQMIEQAKKDIQLMQEQKMMMEKDLEGFRMRMEAMLRAQLDVAESYRSDLT